MLPDTLESRDLQAINAIAETLNRAVDSDTALQSALDKLLEVLELETGWIFLRTTHPAAPVSGPGFRLAANAGLPAVLASSRDEIWGETCDCQQLGLTGKLDQAYTEIHCKRLVTSSGSQHGLQVHASVPLHSGEELTGILNIAGKRWEDFTPRRLALLTSVGSMIGVALERAGQYDELRKRRMQEQSLLLELSNQLLGRGGLQEIADFLVEEVRRLLRVDACALLLPDDERRLLRFISFSGWRSDPLQADHTIPIELDSGPGQVMLSQQPLVVEDLDSYDPTHWAPGWIRAEGFRGHAVVPLVAEGRSIGVLVLDTRAPRRRDEDELRMLQLVANQGAIAVERARMRDEELERRRMEQELHLGRKMQLSLLPDSFPQIEGWEFAGRNLAAREVGGDFYDVFELPGEGGELGFVIADVSGKGVPAALLMAVGRTTIRTTALSGREPGPALVRANELLLKDTRTDLFLSAFYAALDPASGELSYARAGHNYPLHMQAVRGTVRELQAAGIVLGLFDSIQLEQRQTRLEPGDVLLCYTDGVTEALDSGLQPFGVERLRCSLLTHGGKHAPEMLQSILDDIERFTGGELQSDDLTLLVIRRNAV